MSQPAPLLLAAMVEPDLRLRLLETLPTFGWRVLTAGVPQEIPALVSQHGPDALLVDPGMADIAAAQVRSLPMMRVALLPRPDPDLTLTLLRALRVNACLPQDTSPELLAASLDALLRLGGGNDPGTASATPRDGEVLGTWLLHRTAWTLTPPGGEPIRLTQAETTFLATLAEEPGNPVPRPRMIAALGHNIDYYDSRRLDTMVSRLRIKVGKDGSPSLPVRCIHAVGYAFVAPIALDG